MGGVDGYDRMCAIASNNTVQCWGYGFQSYPTTYGVPNVAALGGIDAYVRVLTTTACFISTRRLGRRTAAWSSNVKKSRVKCPGVRVNAGAFFMSAAS